MAEIDEQMFPPVTVVSKRADEVFRPFYPEKPQEQGVITKLGLKKKIITVGEGCVTPDEGDEITVHYTASVLDGHQFASSKYDGKPLVLVIGEENILKGCTEGLVTMKEGEVSIFTLPPEISHGVQRLYPGIARGTTVQFQVELISWLKVVDVCNDGGIMKKILVKSNILQRPENKDEVTVKYEAKLENGSVVARSSEKGVEFLVADGHLCPAIAKSVVTMRKGEKAILRVLPNYAFGAKGRTAREGFSAVPRNAVIIMTLELVAYKLLEYITEDKKVIKKIITTGKSWLKPNTGTIAQIRYWAKTSEGTIFDKGGYDGESPFEFVVDEDQVISGLDLAAATMKQGEFAQIIVSPEYGFGNIAKQSKLAVVPPHSTLYYEVEMVNFTKVKESWDMEPDERIEHAKKRKEEGNKYYKAGKYMRASLRYDQGAKYVEFDSTFNPEQKKIGKFFRVTCILNNAACKLKLKEYNEAVHLCTKVLQLEPYNVKALSRRAQAYRETNDLDLAEVDLLTAIEIEPDNGQLNELLEKLKSWKAYNDKKDSKFYTNMLAKLKV